MTYYSPPWESDLEPNEGNVRTWLDNIYAKCQPNEQARWIESSTDCNFVAGDQRFINQAFNFNPNYSWQTFHFNIIQQPINMVTGYQRQHRKSVSYIPSEGGDPHTTDQYTRLITHANNNRSVLEKYSRSCEGSAVQGMVLMQPYLDFVDDPVNGTVDLKIWDYNSFLTDSYWREPDMSDANLIWCQQFISKSRAENLFGKEKIRDIQPISGTSYRQSRFYFLPENYNAIRPDLLVQSYVWYRHNRKRKKLFNKLTGEMFEFTGEEQELQELIPYIGDDVLEAVEVTVPTWKLAVVVNEQLVWKGENPLNFDECPLIPVYWNRDPQITNPSLRVRSLTRAMRDAQFLFNRRVILNHDISESSINSGFKYMEDSIANPENLNYAGQGKHLIIKSGYDLSAIEKIIPNAVPASDLQLADQMADLIYRVSGVNQELMGMSQEKGLAGITEMLRQGAGLITLQKYFDQWDYALKLLGNLELKIVQNNWSPIKVARILGEEPTPYFFSKMFAKCQVIVAEGLDTSIQRQQEFAQLMQLNEALGGIIPAPYLASKATIQGKQELMEILDAQVKQKAEQEQQAVAFEQAGAQANLQLLYARAASEIAMARERHGRAESNIGLFEERLSEISQNRSMATKNKVDALEKLLEVINRYGELEASLRASNLESVDLMQEQQEDKEKFEAKQTSLANDFFNHIMVNQEGQSPGGQNAPAQSQLTESLI